MHLRTGQRSATPIQGNSMMGRKGALLLLFGGVFILSLVLSAQAQKVAEKRTFADWTIYEERDFDSEAPPAPKGIADAAWTNALHGRDASLGLSCGPYSVSYLIRWDDQFSEATKAATGSAGEIENRRIYTKTDKYDLLEAVFVSGGYRGLEFTTFTERLVVAGN